MIKLRKLELLIYCLMLVLALIIDRNSGFIFLVIYSMFLSSKRFFTKSTPWYLVCLYFLCILVPIEVLSTNSFKHIYLHQDNNWILSTAIIFATIPFVIEIINMRKLFRKRNLIKLLRKLNSTKLFRKRKKT
jgi:hypothetical protein